MITRMQTTEEDRSLDEIVTENAILWLKRRIASRRVERKPYTLAILGEEMLACMKRGIPSRSYRGFEVPAADHVARTVQRHLGLTKGEKSAWRLDYLEAFYLAMGITLQELTEPVSKLEPKELALLDELTEDVRWIVPPAQKKTTNEP